MKKYIVGGVVGALIVGYVIFANSNTGNVGAPMDNATGGAPTATPSPLAAGGGNPGNGTPAPQATPTPQGQYKNGTYTGPVTNAFYGNIQVVATVQGGKLTSVSVPVYPDAPGHTSEVSAAAIPILKQEAVAAQGANVNIVSGATQTSEAFQQSLTAALSQAS